MSWSRQAQDGGTSGVSAGDTRTARSSEPRYHDEEDRVAAEAVDWGEQCLVCLGLPADEG